MPFIYRFIQESWCFDSGSIDIATRSMHWWISQQYRFDLNWSLPCNHSCCGSRHNIRSTAETDADMTRNHEVKKIIKCDVALNLLKKKIINPLHPFAEHWDNSMNSYFVLIGHSFSSNSKGLAETTFITISQSEKCCEDNGAQWKRFS